MASPDLVALAAAVLQARRDPERVLEIDCGDGARTLFLAREYPRTAIRGVDAAPEAVAAAISRIGLDPEGRLAFKVGDAGSLGFPDEHFDIVVHAGGASAEIARVLRHGGELISVAAERPGDPLGLRRRRFRRRLSKHGFVVAQSGGAGGGAYIVARLQ
jgi:ubiquinone/menaquinone biosynthesis C-methylase UbiE